MDLTPDDIAAIRFRGTRYAYDRSEVDRFRDRVIAALVQYEEALAAANRRNAELERRQGRQVRRPEPRQTAPAQSATDEQDFDVWRASLSDAARRTRIIEAALEEARMVRQIAAEQAAEEIVRLTHDAREEALRITQRAARLATSTEEAARRRAGEILGASGAPDTAADIEVLTERIVHLRSTIAAVQDRLESMTTDLEDDRHAADDHADVIEIDLRASNGTAVRSRAASDDGVPTTEELEARIAELQTRLDSD